ncbi:MAG: HDOD domain-containing protein [Phycisphaerales bacterium]|nr:HDOD domain-containing protein [Planctomycetota bacterium]MCH8507979.1 HDOD domain-containing protein [Phycisphaerales bacterium]
MPVTEEQRQQVVESAIREISHIATLPEVTLRIIELVEDPTSTAQDLHAVISNDPALSSRILKVVNSSFYGLPGQISSINRAIVMLGLNAVKNIAIAASLAKLFRGGELTPTFSAKELWNHSNATAIGCKLLSDTMGMGLGDESYLAGLIHDIGIMVEMQYDRSKLIDALDKTGAGPDGIPTTSLLVTEEQVFGANHQHFGQGLCAKWKFPAPFAAATGFHHNPTAAPSEQSKLVAVVHAADCLAGRIERGFRLDNPDCNIHREVREVLKLNDEKINELTEKLQSMVADSANMI